LELQRALGRGVPASQYELDQQFRRIEASPQVVVLAVVAPQERTEVEEDYALELRLIRGRRPEEGGLARADADHLHRVPLTDARQGLDRIDEDVPVRKA